MNDAQPLLEQVDALVIRYMMASGDPYERSVDWMEWFLGVKPR